MLIKANLHTSQRGVPATAALNAVGSEQHWQELAGQQEHTPAHGKVRPTLGGPAFCGSKDAVLVYQEKRRKDKGENMKGMETLRPS